MMPSTNSPPYSSFRKALPWVSFVTLLFAMNYSARTALSPLMVHLEASFNVGHTQATSLLFMQGLGASVSFFISGFLLSRIRPRNMITISQAASGCMLLAMPFVTDMFEARFVFTFLGMTAGLYFSAGMTTLRSLVRHEDWGKAVGIHEFAPNMSFMVFPLYAQALLPFFSWQIILGLWGGLMLVVALLFHLYGKGGTTHAASISIGGSLHLFKHPSTILITLFLIVSIAGEFAIYVILQLYLISEHAMLPKDANLVLSLSRMSTPLMVLIGGWAADSFSSRRLLALFFGAHAFGLVLMCLPVFWVAMIGVSVQAMSIALLFPALFKLIAECFPTDMLALVLSMSMPFAGLAGTGLAPWALGAIGENFGFNAGLLGLAFLSIACVPLFFWIKVYHKAQATLET